MELIIKSKRYGQMTVFFDDDDYPIINKHNWYISKSRSTFYARTNRYENGLETTIRMHMMLMGFPDSRIDHINGNGLDNRKQNLRLCTNSQNCLNKDKRKDNTTGYKGVWFHKKNNKFICSTTINGKVFYGGSFQTVQEAAKRYNELALIHHGEFAKLNII
jgi:hypothetical protein